MTTTMTTLSTNNLPKEFVDAHHHFLDTKNNEFSRGFLGSLLKDTSYLPYQYQKDVVEPLEKAGVKLVGSVHIEAMPDDGWKETEWVSSQESTVAAIVASCDLAAGKNDVEKTLEQLKQCPEVKGVRWILDCVGPFEPNTATHVATLRHDGIDYLRGSKGDYRGETVPAFEEGFALLGKYGFSFDLQCAPEQLLQAAALCARHPNVPICIEHLGKPRLLLKPDNDTDIDEKELEQWRAGMKAMSKLPHVYVKVSMLGYAVPGWTQTPKRLELVKQLVHEVVDLFGANRCMVALNWWKDSAMSDSDGMSSIGPDPVQFLRYMSSFFDGYSETERNRLFAGTARDFYKF